MNIEKVPAVFSSGFNLKITILLLKFNFYCFILGQYKLESVIMLKGKVLNGLNVLLNLEHI